MRDLVKLLPPRPPQTAPPQPRAPAPPPPASAERRAFAEWVEDNADKIWAVMRAQGRRNVTFDEMAEHLWRHA